MRNVMIDFETLDKKPTAIVLSVGAVKFNKEKIGGTFYREIDIQSCIDLNLTMSGSTFYWWMTQEQEARTIFTEKNTQRVSVQRMLIDLSSWLYDESLIWSNGADFDIAIMNYLYDICFIKRPYKFWNTRCYRTVASQFPDIKRSQEGIKHHALQDAINQAKHLINIAPDQLL